MPTAAPTPVAEDDLGPFAGFVSRPEAATDDPASPNEDDCGPFRAFVPASSTPHSSAQLSAAPSPAPGADFGAFSRFVPPSPTPHSDAAVAETPDLPRGTDQLEQRLSDGAQYLEDANRLSPNRPDGPRNNEIRAPDPSDPKVIDDLAKRYADTAMRSANQPLLSLPTAPIKQGDSVLHKTLSAAYNTVANFVSGSTSEAGVTMLLNPLAGAVGIFSAVPELANRVREADKTPPGSPERYQAGSDVVGFLALPAVMHGLSKLGGPKTPVESPGAAPATTEPVAPDAQPEAGTASPDAPIPASSGVDPLDQPPFAESDSQSSPVSNDTPAPNAPDGSESSATPSEGEISSPDSGTVRLYHGGAGEVAGSDFTPSLDYAQGYADKAGGQVFHVDVPADASFLRRDEGAGNRLLNRQVLPNEIADQARPLESSATETDGSADEPLVPPPVQEDSLPEPPDVSLIEAVDNPEFAQYARQLLSRREPPPTGRHWVVMGAEGHREFEFTNFGVADDYMRNDAMGGERLIEVAPGEPRVTLPYKISSDRVRAKAQWTQTALRHYLKNGEITMEQAREAGLRDQVPSVPASSGRTPFESRPNQAATTSYPLDDIAPEVSRATPRVAGDAAQKELITGMSERARQSLGPGAASADEFPLIRAENAREYATIGAAHLLEGKSDKASWVKAMQEEYGARDASPQELNKIWRDSHDLLHDFRAAQTGTPLRPKAQIEQSTGIRPGLAIVKGQLSDAVNRAEALSGYLQGMEKGSKLGAAARQKQLSIANKWLAADQEKVRRTLTEFVSKTLPPSERGRFTGAVTRALRRPDLVRGDPNTMYRNAFRVMQAIENRSEDVHRGNLIGEIKKISARILDSPSVDLAAKRILQRTLSEISLRTPQKSTVQSLGKTREFLDRMAAAGKDVLMPQKVLANLEQLEKRPIKELPTTTIEDLHTKIRVAEKIGRMRVKTRGAQWEAEKKMRLSEIQAGDGTPLAMRELFRPQPGERLSLGERVRNWTARRLNYATAFDLGHLPVDVHFDLLQGGKGTYSGPLFDHIRNPIDAAYDRAQSRAMQELEPLREIIKRNKLSDVDEDLIGLWAQLQQEGGEARAMESGVTKATIDKLKGSGLTKAQKEAYDYMRGRLDATLPEVQSVMHELFNIDVEAVEHYFPWMRDWESYKPSADRPVFDARTGQEVSPEMLDSFGKLAGDYAMRDTTKLQRGFTIDRMEGAKTPIRTDSFDVFQRHMYSASRLIEMQRDLKMTGEIIRDDAFAKKFGAYGQRMLNQWLTAVATDGRGNNVHRMPLLDMVRRGSNRALVFFRLTSNVKHLSAVPQAVVNSGGPEYFFRGLHGIASKEGQAFLKNFPQVTERQAGDMSLQELQRSMGNTPSGLFPKGLALADRYGFVLGKEIDAVNSRAVFLGRYLRNLEDRGIKTGFSGPVNQSAASNALAFMRRTVSSTLAKDVQPVLGRGQGFGGNVSVTRTMNAFRQYALERWSLLRYDMPAAFASGNYTRGVALLAAAAAAGLYETNIAGAIRHAAATLAGQGATGHDEKEHESWLNRLMVDGFSMVPYANNIISAVQWGQSGIPLVDNFVNAGKTAKHVTVAKTDEGKKSALIGAAGAAAQLSGVPGSGVATSLARNALVDKDKMKREAAKVRVHHRAGSR